MGRGNPCAARGLRRRARAGRNLRSDPGADAAALRAMNLVLLPQASAELADAVEYYESEQAGLGERLWLEVDDYLRWIAANATLPRLRHGVYRRMNLKVLPYYNA